MAATFPPGRHLSSPSPPLIDLNSFQFTTGLNRPLSKTVLLNFKTAFSTCMYKITANNVVHIDYVTPQVSEILLLGSKKTPNNAETQCSIMLVCT